MKNVFYDGRGCRFMSWEQNPNKRNVNNRVTFLVNQNQEVNVGDILVGDNLNGVGVSTYTITEVVDRRVSKQTGHHHLTVLTHWENRASNGSNEFRIENLPRLI